MRRRRLGQRRRDKWRLIGGVEVGGGGEGLESDGLAGGAKFPGGQERIVIVHGDDGGVRAGGLAELAENPGKVGADNGEAGFDAGLIDAGGTDAAVDVVGSDIECDESDVALVSLQEGDGGGELAATCGIVRTKGGAALDHGRGVLADAAEFGKSKAGDLRAIEGEKVVGVALCVRGAGDGLVADGEGIAEGDINNFGQQLSG